MGRCERSTDIEAINVARIAHDVCADKKGRDIKILSVSDLTIVADYFVICTAGSDRNAIAMADAILSELRDKGVKVLGTEGRDTGWWVLLDFGDVLVHIFQEDARQYYALDETWADANDITEDAA